MNYPVGIAFTARSVLAILAKQKNQTRRLLGVNSVGETYAKEINQGGAVHLGLNWIEVGNTLYGKERLKRQPLKDGWQ